MLDLKLKTLCGFSCLIITKTIEVKTIVYPQFTDEASES